MLYKFKYISTPIFKLYKKIIIIAFNGYMSITEGKFWRQCDDYHDISKEFERNVQIVHPSYTKNYLSSF
jgi:hypothetical protein